MNILAQVLSGVSLILSCTSYFIKYKPLFIICQCISNAFYASSLFVVGANVGGYITLVSIIRCLFIYVAEKKSFKHINLFLLIFVATYITLGIVFWEYPFDFIPIITASIFAFGFAIKDMQKLRIVSIIPNAMLIVYNILTTTYINAFSSLISILAIVLAIVKYHKQSEKTKSEVST